jgi:hypothetical protein
VLRFESFLSPAKIAQRFRFRRIPKHDSSLHYFKQLDEQRSKKQLEILHDCAFTIVVFPLEVDRRRRGDPPVLVQSTEVDAVVLPAAAAAVERNDRRRRRRGHHRVGAQSAGARGLFLVVLAEI